MSLCARISARHQAVVVSSSSDQIKSNVNNNNNKTQSPKQHLVVTRSELLKTSISLAATSLLQTSIPPASTASSPPTLISSLPGLGSQTPQSLSKVVLSTLSDCQLAVSIYPTFSYNALGGGGTGTINPRDDGLLDISFDANNVNIPPITYSTSAIFGIPIPPPLKISIFPEKLSGTIDPETGETNLDFLARFEFTAGPLYSAPPLIVETVLTSESSNGVLRSGKGQRLNADGHVKLVGVARVPKTGDLFLDTFLILPTDALAVMSADMKFS